MSWAEDNNYYYCAWNDEIVMVMVVLQVQPHRRQGTERESHVYLLWNIVQVNSDDWGWKKKLEWEWRWVCGEMFALSEGTLYGHNVMSPLFLTQPLFGISNILIKEKQHSMSRMAEAFYYHHVNQCSR